MNNKKTLKNKNNKDKKEKTIFFKKVLIAVTSLIGTLLLVSVGVLLTVSFLNFGKDFSISKLEENVELKEITEYRPCEYSAAVFVNARGSNNILLRNNHSQDLELIGYSILSSLQLSGLNETIMLESSIPLASGRSGILNIACYPEREFTLELLFEDECRVTKKITVTSFNSEECEEEEEDEPFPEYIDPFRREIYEFSFEPYCGTGCTLELIEVYQYHPGLPDDS